MRVTKVVEITLRDVISYDDSNYTLYQACNKLAKIIVRDLDIHDAVELTGKDAMSYDLDTSLKL
jgi:hypothetical protein